MKSTRNLRLRLRLIEGALVVGLGALTTGAVATHQLLLDATNRPTDDVSFSGPHWTGTLDAARLPASLPLLDAFNNLTAGGLVGGVWGQPSSITLGYEGPNGDLGNLQFQAVGSVTFSGTNVFFGGGIAVAGAGISTVDGTNISTPGNGYVNAAGYGAPADTTAPIGSLYMDQDPNGFSGHVLWVMEPGGWVGK